MGLRVDPEAIAGLSEVEREAVAADLRVVEEEFARNPLLGYEPHVKQRVFHAAPHPPSRLFLGGNRSGKTTCTMVDSIIQAVDRELVPRHLEGIKRWEPPFYCRVVTPDLTNTLEGVVLQKFREWCPREQLLGNSFDRAWDKALRMLRFKNGSWFQFFSNDQDLDKFGGAALHRVVFDESPRGDIRRESLMRLIDYGGDELFGLTPLEGMASWVYDEFYAPWERGELLEGDARVVLVDMDDNPHLDQVTKKRVLKGLSREEREARKSGKFVAFAGLIYPDFDRHRHVVPQVEQIPAGAEVFVGIDPGIRHMHAVLYAYLTAEDDLVVFDEIALQDVTIRQVCKEIHRRNELWRVRPRWYVIDPSSRNRSTQTGRSEQQEFVDNGVVTIPGQNDEVAGINRVRERIEADRFHVGANCVELIDEFRKYRWVRDSGRSEDSSRARPVRKDDHLLDCARYICMQRPLVPEIERELPSMTTKDRLLRHALKQLDRLGGRDAPDSGFGPGIFN